MVKLKKANIIQTFQNIFDLVGSSLFVAVGVLTESGKKARLYVCVLCSMNAFKGSQNMLP